MSHPTPTVTNSETTIAEIEDGIYRIHTPFRGLPGGFSFNQILVVDDEPLLFHTGGRSVFPAVRAAIERVIPIASLRYVGFSHVEADECGALDDVLAAAPSAQAVASRVAAMATSADTALRPLRPLADGESLTLGKRRVTWIDAPHVPHGWDCGFLFETTTRTLLCGDLFTQPGADGAPVTESDVLGPSEAFRTAMDYFAHAPQTRELLLRIASTEPRTLACMHGSAFRGDGGAALRALADAVAPQRA
jgi:flavorubredoxin